MVNKRRNIGLIQKAAEKTWQASAWWLERRYNEEYGKRERIDMKQTHKVDKQTIEDMEKLWHGETE